MERLTYRAELGVSIDKNEDCPTCSICWNCDIKVKDCSYFNDAVEKLADYEDAEEQGLLLRLQFKIGQKVYYIYESCIDKSLMIGSMIYSYSCLDFPREYFATKEEAEKALKQMGE